MRKLLIFWILVLVSFEGYSQRPKLNLKLHGGIHSIHFTFRERELTTENFFGWQVGFGSRLSYREAFSELDINFVRSEITVLVSDSVVQASQLVKGVFQVNAVEVPIKFGWIPIKGVLFKWYLYTGPTVRFNTRGIFRDNGTEVKLKPRDVSIPGVQLNWNFGTQFDIAFLNIDLMYMVGVTNATKTNVRANTHQVQLVFGILF